MLVWDILDKGRPCDALIHYGIKMLEYLAFRG